MTSRRNLTLPLAVGVAAVTAGLLIAKARKTLTPDERERIGYPPLDTPKPIGEGIWIVDSGPIKPMGMTLPIRMTIIRLSEGQLLLHSPVRMTASLTEKVEQLGRIKHLVAPSIGHWTFLKDWQRAFPDATTWAVPGLRNRRQVRKAGLRIDRDLASSAPDEWRTRSNKVWSRAERVSAKPISFTR